jgi:cell division protein FtsI (penicillin-binding protein 3)
VRHFIRLFFLLKLLIFCAVLGQGANIQILPHSKLDQYKNVQFYKKIKIQARRGRIYDRKEKELAINEPTYSVFADPVNVKSARWAAQKISRHLGMNPRSLEKKMNRHTRFVWLKRRINLNAKNEIQKLNISGVYFVSEPQRQYPGRDISSALLGFVGAEGKGLEGLEYFYDEYLTGKDVDLRVSRDAKGRPLSIDPEQYTNPPEGHDLLLSIDSEYQRFLEMQLKTVYETHMPKSAYGLVLDTETGAIRASAQWPTYDANGSNNTKKENRKNLLFHEALEQGSTIKPIAAGAALESGIYKPGSQFACLDGKINIGRRVISDSKKSKCEFMTLTEGLKVSSNVVFTQVALGVGEEKMRSFYNKIGFGEKTNVDFPGEAKGIYNSQRWPKHLLASASFGHGFTATPIQVAAAYAAIANDGVWNQPYMVEKIISPTGLSKGIERDSRRVMSAKTAQVLRAMMTEVTQEGGTGKNAAVEGYLVAGKTGTANKVNLVNGGYYKDKYLSSFVGMVPAEKPRFVIYIGVDEPQNKHYGSEVAAPVFSKVAQFILNKENIAPTKLVPNEMLNCTSQTCGYKPLAKNSTDSMQGLTLREALRFLKDKPVRASFRGQGLVSRVIFEEGDSLNTNSKVIIKFE